MIEKFNKANEVCRDIATFLSSCGQAEFQEKLAVLINLKTEWQCSQITHNPLVENESKQSEATAVVANDELVSCFKLKVDPGHCDTIDSPVKDMHDTDEE